MTRKTRNGKELDDDVLGFEQQIPVRASGTDGSRPNHNSADQGKSAQVSELQEHLHALETAVREDPEDAANWFEFGKLLLDSGQDRRAEAMLRQAVRRAPESGNYRFYLGTALGNNGKFAEAAGQFRWLADVDSELADPMSVIGLSARTHLAYCLGEMGRWKEAVETLTPEMNTAISIIDDLAGFIAKCGDYKQGCFLYSVALLIAPRSGSLLHGAGYCHMKAGRLKEALNHLQKARRALPEDPDVGYNLGLTLTKMKRRKAARRCFRRVLQLDPKYFWAWYDLACFDALEGRPAQAFRNLYKAIECGFKDSDFLLRDADFKSIRKDPRWKVVLECMSNKSTNLQPNHAVLQ